MCGDFLIYVIKMVEVVMCGLQIRQKRGFGQFLNLYSALTYDEFLTILKALFSADTRKKMNLFKISRFSNSIKCFPDFPQCFPDYFTMFPRFFTNKIFQGSQVRTLRYSESAPEMSCIIKLKHMHTAF